MRYITKIIAASALVFSSATFAQENGWVADSVSYEWWDYESAICNVSNYTLSSYSPSLGTRLDNFNSSNTGSSIKRVAERVGTNNWAQYPIMCRNYGNSTLNPALGLEEMQLKSERIKVTTYVKAPSDDNGIVDSKRPDIKYYDNNEFDLESDRDKTWSLDTNISEGVNKRMNSNLETGRFQFKKSACANNSNIEYIGNCYRTSREGSVKKVGVQ